MDTVCPAGTKAWLLCLGYMTVDEGWLIRGGNQSFASQKGVATVNKRRLLPMYSVLIEHPGAGLLLWETGPGPNYPEVWGPETSDAFSRSNYEPVQELDAAIASTGHSIKEITAVIQGHLHLDHSGGLTFFKGTDVPIYCHTRELKNAFYSVATKADIGVYLPHYLDLSLNWQTFDEKEMEFAQDGLVGMQINLPNDGTYLFTSDQFHVKENYLDGVAPGWVTRDHNAWFDSLQRVRRLALRKNAVVVMGHDIDVCNQVWEKQEGISKPLS
ncbi:hypothetical protein OIO90_003782 [Microbotryomycetes sp. JL221]|nr:hypothetical protein OIO90_003782 [Microbotryomycetes sp. JL221]